MNECNHNLEIVGKGKNHIGRYLKIQCASCGKRDKVFIELYVNLPFVGVEKPQRNNKKQYRVSLNNAV